MAQDFDVVSANLLPAATSVTDNDMILIIQSSRVKRALPSAMKGKQGDPGLSPYLGVTENYVQWKQGASGAWQNLIALDNLRGLKGEKPLFRKQGGVLQMKYEGEPNSAYQNIFDREELKLQFSDLTASEIDQLKLHFSDLTEENKTELMKPATDAAATVTQKMTEIEQTVAETIKEVNTAKEAAHTAAERATTAADNVQDGKTPVVVIGSVEDGSEAGASMTPAGTDETGNPKSALNLILPKGATGPAPVLELGTVTTVEPSDPASATFEPNGTDSSGANKYRLDLSIPKGKAGKDGTGAGNVLVSNEASLLAAKQYAFKPGQDGSVNGSFVEVAATGGALDLSPFLNADNNTISDEYYNVLQKAYEDKVTTGLIGDDVVPIGISVTETEISIVASVISIYNFDEHEGSNFDFETIQIIVNKEDRTSLVSNGHISFITRGDGTKALMDNGKYESVLTEVPSHTLNLSPLFDSNSDPLPTVTDQFIVELKKAYAEKYSNCTAAAFDNAVMPMSIQKTEDGYTIVISSSFDNGSALAFLSYNFVIDTVSKTLSFTPKGAQLEIAGDGTKALMDDGQYKTVGDIYRLPEAIMYLDENSTSDEIFAAWGGRDVLLNFVKNYDVSKVCIMGISDAPGGVTYNAQVRYEYTDDTNFVVEIYINIAGENIILATTVVDGLAAVSLTIGAETPKLTSTSSRVYFKYTTQDGELMWNNNDADEDVGGTGPRYAAYSRNKNVKIEDAGDGTQFLSDDGTYKTVTGGSSGQRSYLIDVDITGTISEIPADNQIIFYGKTYTKPTNENIIELLGGAAGIRDMCEKLNQKNGVVGIIPTQVLAYYPSYCVLDYITFFCMHYDAATDTGSVPVSPGDGDVVNILAGYWFNNGEQPFYGNFSIGIENFNTADQTVTYQHSFKPLKEIIGPASSSKEGLLSAEDKQKIDRVRSYVTTTSLSSLSPDAEVIYATISSNQTLGVSGVGESYNGRSLTVYVLPSGAFTITIPTTGDYVSMCGSRLTTVSDQWVEFNLTCVAGKWHIAKLEQE